MDGGAHRPAGIMGAYSASIAFQTVAGPGASTAYMAFRWTSTSALCLLESLSLRASQTTAAATGIPTFGLFVGRGFTATHTGGTAPTIGANTFKKATSYPTTQLANGNLRYGVGAALAGGTVTLDAEPIASVVMAGQQSFEAATGPHVHYDNPIVLSADEGLVLMNLVAVTGGVTKGVLTLEWFEVDKATAQAVGL